MSRPLHLSALAIPLRLAAARAAAELTGCRHPSHTSAGGECHPAWPVNLHMSAGQTAVVVNKLQVSCVTNVPYNSQAEGATSRGLSFCTWTLVTLKPEVQVIADTLKDGRCAFFLLLFFIFLFVFVSSHRYAVRKRTSRTRHRFVGCNVAASSGSHLQSRMQLRILGNPSARACGLCAGSRRTHMWWGCRISASMPARPSFPAAATAWAACESHSRAFPLCCCKLSCTSL